MAHESNARTVMTENTDIWWKLYKNDMVILCWPHITDYLTWADHMRKECTICTYCLILNLTSIEICLHLTCLQI